MTIFEGNLDGAGLRIAIVVARFNGLVTDRLLAGAQDALRRHSVSQEMIDVVWVPGSFELPVAAKRLAEGGAYDAVLCLGTIIRGDTPHFDYVAGQTASGIASVALSTGIPTIFGVLTTDTTEQALERAGVKAGNKGSDSAVTAIEMGNLFRLLGRRETAST